MASTKPPHALTDAELSLVRAFESADLPANEFTHAAHVRVAWCYLQQHRFTTALDRFTHALRAYARAKGVPELYHETVSVAWMAIINERLEAPDVRALTWEAFAAAQADLFEKLSPLNRYYRDEILRSAEARRVFLLPR